MVTAAGPVDFNIRPAAGDDWTKISTVTAAGPGTVTTDWIPTEPGEFVLNANQDGDGNSAPP